MLQLTVKAAKGGFFDRPEVLRALDAATRRALSKFGAFVRTRARSSIRKRKRASLPGKPPSSHIGTLRRFLFFVYEPSQKTVVIGPARVGGTVDPGSLKALEFGGVSTVLSGKAGKRKTRRATIAARPFMGPALDAERDKLADLWRGSVRK